MSSKTSVSTFKVCVENLRQEDLDVKELTEMFSDFGKILSFKVISNNNASDKANDTNVSIRYRSVQRLAQAFFYNIGRRKN